MKNSFVRLIPPNLTESVSVDENGVLHITVTNLSLTEDYEIDTTILEKNISEVKGEILTEEMHAMNTFEEPETVRTKEFTDVKITDADRNVRAAGNVHPRT